MIYRSAKLAEIMILTPETFVDSRGKFRECFRKSDFEHHCGNYLFVQENISRSIGGTLRGLHFQKNKPQGKLIQVISGSIYDVAVDIRLTSPNYGQWFGYELNDKHGELLWIPPGFAHGFYVMSEIADVIYKCTDYYDSSDEVCINWASPNLSITWPLINNWPLSLSEKDRHAPFWP